MNPCVFSNRDALDRVRQKRLAELETDLGSRLSGDKESPVRRSLATDLAHLKSLIRQKQESSDA